MKATLIYNPRCGRWWRRPGALNRLEEWFTAEGVKIECRQTIRSGHGAILTQQAIQDGCTLVIAFGGDGTINDILGAVVGTDVPLAILPGGTANVLARELRIPMEVRQAVRVAVRGFPQRISLGRAGNRYFHLMAGIGLDAFVVGSMPPRLKDFLGVYSFWVQGFRKFTSYPFEPFQVEMNGQVFDATFAVIANARNYGGSLRLAPEAALDSDEIDVCLFRSRSRLRYLYYLLTARVGYHVRLGDVTYQKAQRVTVRGCPSIGVQVDGELAGNLPMDFEILPACLSVMVPRSDPTLRP